MLTYPYHKAFLLTVLILFSTSLSHALEVEVRPDTVSPGDVFLLIINAAPPAGPEAEFQGKEIIFYPHHQEQQFLALVPVSLEARAGRHEILIKAGSEAKRADITVRSYEFPTRELTLPKEKVTLSPENQKRVEQEYLLQQKIWRSRTVRAWDGGFMRPLDTEISEVFGVKRIMNRKKTSVHRGMDFRGQEGTPVKAINSGTVVLVKDLFYGGNTVVVDHGMGLFSVYMHLSRSSVSEQHVVEKGQTVGLVGMSGRATGPHLHMSVKLQGTSVNPQSLFDLEM